MSRPPRLAADDVTAALTALPDWSGDGSSLSRSVTCRDFRAAVRLVTQVADVAEEMDHHPDIDIRWRTVRFGLTTHDAGGVTELDLQLARRIDALAAGAA